MVQTYNSGVLQHHPVKCGQPTALPSIILCLNLKESLRMLAYGADCRCFLSDDDMSAVHALPYAVVVTREYYALLNIAQQLAVTLLVGFLNLGNHLK